ncbi:MAG: hypothetical protein ACRERE_13915 [Candidatus Entotheonellia bacterium]
MSGQSPMIALTPRGLNDTMLLATIGDFQAYRCMAVDGERS